MAFSPSTGSPRVIVGLDFGTSFSGFAFASPSDPTRVYEFEDWPGQNEATGQIYSKTGSYLWYGTNEREARDWGWPAFLGFSAANGGLPRVGHPGAGNRGRLFASQREMSNAGISGHLLSSFKLHLAEGERGGGSATWQAPKLPPGLSVDDVITEYISKLGKFALREVRNKFGGHIEMEDIQWALTVPAIWSDRAKQRMRIIAQKAGLIQNPQHTQSRNGSPHPLHIVLEPEAASIFCQKVREFENISIGSRFLVVDAGGGTVDLVVQVREEGGRTKEASRSTGGICGGKMVDELFLTHVQKKIECFDKIFRKRHPWTVVSLLKQWQENKQRFRGLSSDDCHIDIPPALAEKWEDFIEENSFPPTDVDEIVISPKEMKSIFDPVVADILDLIREQLKNAPQCRHILTVGGFSSSPYLLSRIRSTFPDKNIISPSKPGSAVCVGAVMYGLNPNLGVYSRISKKTYGIRTARPFQFGDPPEKMFFVPFSLLCADNFTTFVTIGQSVTTDEEVKHVVHPIHDNQTSGEIVLFSTDNESPSFVTDPGSIREGSFDFGIPDTTLGTERDIEVTMFFGKSTIEVIAKGKNFGGGAEARMIPVQFSFV